MDGLSQHSFERGKHIIGGRRNNRKKSIGVAEELRQKIAIALLERRGMEPRNRAVLRVLNKKGEV